MFKCGLLPLELNQPYSEVYKVIKFVGNLDTNCFYLLHVLSPDENKEKMTKKLNGIAKNLREKGLDIETFMEEGHPAKTICKVAREKGVDYIYIPANCRNIIHRTFLGSTARDVLRLTDKPTLVHKVRPNLKEKICINRILFATDFGETADRAKNYIKFLGKTTSELLILNVGKRASDPCTEKNRRKEIGVRLKNLKDEMENYYSKVIRMAEIGTPHKIIFREAEKNKVDLVVIGRFNPGVGTKIMGTTSENVTTKTKASVLLVP